MPALRLKNLNQKILVIGSLYDQVDKLTQHPNWFTDHEQIIFNGNLCYPDNNLHEIRSRIKVVDTYLQLGNVIYNMGDKDLLLMKKLWESGEAPDIYHWLRIKSNIVIIDFASQSSLTITNGGVTPQMTRSGLQDNLETSFVSNLEGRAWHELYGGGCGYIIANNPLTQNKPKFYNYSVQIGTIYCPNTAVYAIQAHAHGLGHTFSL